MGGREELGKPHPPTPSPSKGEGEELNNSYSKEAPVCRKRTSLSSDAV